MLWCRFLPNYCPGFEKVIEAKGGVAMVDMEPNVLREVKRRLELQLWLPAWDAYAIAGAILDQFEYKRTHLHKAIVLEQAMQAEAAGQGTLVGVLYDEFARWHSLFVCALLSSVIASVLQEGVG